MGSKSGYRTFRLGEYFRPFGDVKNPPQNYILERMKAAKKPSIVRKPIKGPPSS